MNWKIGVNIWLKGLVIFIIPCLVFLGIGFIAFFVALLTSWLAIPIYSLCLYLLKKLSFSYWVSMTVMIVLPTVASVLTALGFAIFIEQEIVPELNGVVFWIPLICCVLSILFSRDSIHCYLQPNEITNEFLID